MVTSTEPGPSGGIRGFTTLLEDPTTRAFELLRAYRELARDERRAVEPALLDWVFGAGVAREEGLAPIWILEEVPVERWTDEEVLVALELEAAARRLDVDAIDRLAPRARARLAGEPRWEAVEARIAARLDLAAAERAAPSLALARRRPDLDAIERMFAVRLPPRLRQAWALWTEEAAPGSPQLLEAGPELRDATPDSEAQDVSEFFPLWGNGHFDAVGGLIAGCEDLVHVHLPERFSTRVGPDLTAATRHALRHGNAAPATAALIERKLATLAPSSLPEP